MSTYAKLPETIHEFESAITAAQTIGDVARITASIKAAASLSSAEKVFLLTHAAEREQQILEFYLPKYSLRQRQEKVFATETQSAQRQRDVASRF